jgi:hypothetical protein
MFEDGVFWPVTKVTALVGVGIIVGRISNKAATEAAKGDIQDEILKLKMLRQQLVDSLEDPLSGRENRLTRLQLDEVDDRLDQIKRRTAPKMDKAAKDLGIKLGKAAATSIETGKRVLNKVWPFKRKTETSTDTKTEIEKPVKSKPRLSKREKELATKHGLTGEVPS